MTKAVRLPLLCRLFGHRNRGYMGCECRRCGAWWRAATSGVTRSPTEMGHGERQMGTLRAPTHHAPRADCHPLAKATTPASAAFLELWPHVAGMASQGSRTASFSPEVPMPNAYAQFATSSGPHSAATKKARRCGLLTGSAPHRPDQEAPMPDAQNSSRTAEKDVTITARRSGKNLRAVEWFNAVCPVGSHVLYWPGAREGDPRRSVTRSAAWLLGGHTPVVMVEGYAGGIALSHVLGYDPDTTPLPPEV